MAIKIIQHGHTPMRATCPNCECIFEFRLSDLRTNDNHVETWESINCPECNQYISWWYGEKSGRSTRPNDRPPGV